MRYLEPVFRPPSEAYSYILQVTYGCSNNGCTFCGMYRNKRFSVRPPHEVSEDIEEVLYEKEVDAALKKWLEPVRKKATIEMLIKRGSTQDLAVARDFFLNGSWRSPRIFAVYSLLGIATLAFHCYRLWELSKGDKEKYYDELGSIVKDLGDFRDLDAEINQKLPRIQAGRSLGDSSRVVAGMAPSPAPPSRQSLPRSREA